MALFLSTIVNKVDKKGRVSVPAAFRSALVGQAFPGIVAFRTFTSHPVIEASGIDRMAKFSEELDQVDEASERADYLRAVLGDARQFGWDAEGRIVLPQDWAEFAGIGEEAAFVGQGKFFLIREPTAARAEIDQTIARRRPGARPAPSPAPGPAPGSAPGAAPGAAIERPSS